MVAYFVGMVEIHTLYAKNFAKFDDVKTFFSCEYNFPFRLFFSRLLIAGLTGWGSNPVYSLSSWAFLIVLPGVSQRGVVNRVILSQMNDPPLG